MGTKRPRSSSPPPADPTVDAVAALTVLSHQLHSPAAAVNCATATANSPVTVINSAAATTCNVVIAVNGPLDAVVNSAAITSAARAKDFPFADAVSAVTPVDSHGASETAHLRRETNHSGIKRARLEEDI